MSNLLEIMDQETTSGSEVYLYEKDGKWYAYHHSAEALKRMSQAALKVQGACSFYGVMLEKVEVDLYSLLDMNWFVTLCADSEMMLIRNEQV